MSTQMKVILGTAVSSILMIVFVVVFMNKPSPEFTRQDLLPDTTAVLGATDKKVYLVEFSDFQCPACRAYKPVVDEILKEYRDELVFGYRHFPLDQHPYAFYAASAAEAAAEQGKFWDMYDFLFLNQASLSEEFIDQGAKKLGLDMAKYKKAINSNEVKTKIENDKSDGLQFGVNATPTFFLNGKKLQLFGPEHLKQVVAEEMNNR